MHFPITDSHVHLWDKQELNYSWLQSLPELNQSFLLSELMDATHSLHIESFVFVQAECDVNQSLAEVAWVTRLAKRDARIHGIVAQAPLEQGELIKTQLAELKKNKLVKGIRRVLQSEADDFCLQQNFIQGVKLLSEFNFSFDVCVKAHQLPAVIRLVEQCPKVNFILDHLGKPNVAEKKMSPWQENITRLAAFSNVWCKISGLITEAHHQTWRSEDLRPYILHAIKEFTFDRVMFGSDWPVVNLAGSYAHWVHTLYDLLSDASEQELRKLFHQNAWRCYALDTEIVEI
ncbi:MAG: hypothetical protein ACD_60C00099G0007 [uncultured bacterium]|nr:MAG: hypothetical protein ACD_60C00099G0007 [uncultured bacterium]